MLIDDQLVDLFHIANTPNIPLLMTCEVFPPEASVVEEIKTVKAVH